VTCTCFVFSSTAFLGGTGDDERSTRLVDQNRVDLVDNRIGETTLHLILESEGEVVTQIVEAEFVVGTVGDIARVSLALFRRALRVLDHTDSEAEEAIDGTHPVRVALREVFVDRDDVNALGRQGVQVRRQRRHQRLTFAGAHLGDHSLVQHRAADELHIEMPHLQRTLRSFAHHRKRFRQEIVEGRTLLQPTPKLTGLAAQILIAQALNRRFQLGSGAHIAAVTADEPLVAAAKNTREKVQHLTVLRRNYVSRQALMRRAGLFESGVLYAIDACRAQLVLRPSRRARWGRPGRGQATCRTELEANEGLWEVGLSAR
jgi:hypothetical protein